jgi:hypothetical protein
MLFTINFSTCYRVCKQTAWILIRLSGWAGWSGSMLSQTHYVDLVMAWLISSFTFCLHLKQHSFRFVFISNKILEYVLINKQLSALKRQQFKVTFNKFHKKLNSDISLINWVLHRLQVLFWCPNNQNEFNWHKNR